MWPLKAEDYIDSNENSVQARTLYKCGAEEWGFSYTYPHLLWQSSSSLRLPRWALFWVVFAFSRICPTTLLTCSSPPLLACSVSFLSTYLPTSPRHTHTPWPSESTNHSAPHATPRRSSKLGRGHGRRPHGILPKLLVQPRHALQPPPRVRRSPLVVLVHALVG